MNCKETIHSIEDYLDGRLSAAQAAAVSGHLEGCAECRTAEGRERELRAALRALPVPPPSDGFFEQALARAARDARARTQRRWGYGVGGAIAAGFALLLASNTLLQPAAPLSPPAAVQAVRDDLPGVTIGLYEVRKVSLVVESAQALEQATFAVLLPEGVELAGFPGQREVQWQGALRQGKNLLELPLVARDTAGGELRAYIRHADKQKTFRLRMEVVDPRETALPAAGLKLA